MKNLFLFSMTLILAALFSVACASSPPPAPPPAEPEPVVQQEAAPPATTPAPVPARDSYNRNNHDVILDGAVQHTVRWGDTLVRIARRYYQDGAYYPLILMANDNLIADPDKILPNMTLTIPALRINIDDTRAKGSMHNYFLDTAKIEEQRGRTRTAVLIRGHAD